MAAVTAKHHAHDAGSPAGTARFLAHPRLVAVLSVAFLALLGWIYLGLMVAGMAKSGTGLGALGPGMALFERLAPANGIGHALLEALCRPSFGLTGAAVPDAPSAALTLLMWCAMALAMMVPTAIPMVMTYADIAETAWRKGEPVGSPLALTAGYVAVWMAFALAATILQWALTRAALLDPAMASANGLFSGAIFLGAGAYQFSTLKHACVTLCQGPFSFFFANWTATSTGVFRLGLRQGLYCLGCCWAMMMVMFAVGLMNVVWMAALGIIMTLEKMAATTRFSRVIGIALIAIGIAFVVFATAAHWPAGAG